jgi:hypothetical protein
MDFYVLGPAFWTPGRLRRLWQEEDYGITRLWRDNMENAKNAGTEIYSRVTHPYRDPYFKQTTVMEHAIVYLIQLDCSISDK